MAIKKKAIKKKAAKTSGKTTRKAATRRSTKTPARAAAKKATAAKKASAATPFSLQAPSLTANDATVSVAWYCNVLGFTVKQKWEHEGVFRGGELQAGPVTLYVGQDDWAKGHRAKGEGVRLYWYTRQNVDNLAAAIKSRGGVLESEPKDEYGRRSFTLVDPTGYKITISSER